MPAVFFKYKPSALEVNVEKFSTLEPFKKKKSRIKRIKFWLFLKKFLFIPVKLKKKKRQISAAAFKNFFFLAASFKTVTTAISLNNTPARSLTPVKLVLKKTNTFFISNFLYTINLKIPTVAKGFLKKLLKKKKVKTILFFKKIAAKNNILKSWLLLHCFFFKIKNIIFFNNFLNFLFFIPSELILNFLILKKKQLKKNYLLTTSVKKKFNLWPFLYIEYSIFLEKKTFFLTFFYIFIVKYLESLLSARVCLRVKNFEKNLALFKYFKLWIYTRANPKFKKFNRFFFFHEFLEVLILSFFKKDIKFFELWLLRFLEKLHFKFHKAFLFLFNNFFKDFFKVFKHFFKVKGFKLDVRGKVSVSGNAKKRHYAITYGELSLSKKLIRISFSKSIVPTSTGVLGVELVLTY